MELGDILVKVALKQDLNPVELDFLKQQGNQIQPTNDRVATWAKNGGNSITADTVYARYGQFEYPPIGVSCRATRSGNQAITSGSFQSLTMGTVWYDDIRMINLSASTTKINIRISGKYQISFGAIWQTADGNYFSGLFKNGSQVSGTSSQYMSGSFASNFFFDEINFVTGDYIEMRAKQTTGTDKNVVGWGVAVRLIRKNDSET